MIYILVFHWERFVSKSIHFLSGALLLEIRDDLRVEGRLHANGENSHGVTGAGSGGSILAYVGHLDGAGSIESNGGEGRKVFFLDFHLQVLGQR